MRLDLSNTRSLLLAGALMLAAAPAFARDGGGDNGGGGAGGGGGSDIYHLLHNDPAKSGATPIMDKKNGWKNNIPNQKLPKLGGQMGGQKSQNIAQKDLQACVGVDCLDKQNPPQVKLGIDPKKLASSKPGNKIKDVKLCVGVDCLDKKDPKLVAPKPKDLVELKLAPPVKVKPLPKPIMVKQRPQTESCRSSTPERDWTTGEMVVFNTCSARRS